MLDIQTLRNPKAGFTRKRMNHPLAGSLKLSYQVI